jgi:hypothetical protein
MLPLFYEKAATPAMIKHGMDVQKQAINFLNPGQVPIITVDQPLFALAKFIQWRFPDTHGEDKFVMMLGGFHTELNLWKTLGDLLEGSGWANLLTEADIATSGVADSFLRSSHVKRTRNAHQITLLSLNQLQEEAYQNYKLENSLLSKDAWIKEMEKKSPTFYFWNMILRLETKVFLLIRAHREKNFTLYVEMLEQLTPIFFALDHNHYARWMPIHIRDMKSLPDQTRNKFEEGNWVLSKTKRRFSSIPFDQVHEQENKIVKGSGGAIGLTENPAAFQRWMLSGPENAARLRKFEEEYFPESDDEDLDHHEEGFSHQKTFQRQVRNLSEATRTVGNPFLDEFPELVTIDSRNCMDQAIITSIQSIETLGEQQYKDYVKKVINDRSQPIQEPIKRNALPLFRNPQRKAKPKQGQKIKALQNNVALFGQLFVATQNRPGDLENFFAHESQSFPPSLSDFGKLYLPGTKSQLLKSVSPSIDQEPSQNTVDCKVLDGAAVVHILPVAGVTTFDNYAKDVFIPFLNTQFKDCNRVDVVWDTYVENSLKDSTREKRGVGQRRKVAAATKIPKNWNDFLRNSANKEELFDFLSNKVSNHQFIEGKYVYITSGISVKTNHCVKMPDCNHEEADTRILVHLIHALEQGAKFIQVRTVDTDIVIILIGKFHEISSSFPVQDISVAFGKGKDFRYYSIKQICDHLGEPISQGLLFFHAFTGSDTTSAFRGKGKQSAWQTWKSFVQATQTFQYLACHPFSDLNSDSPHFLVLQKFVVFMYNRTSPLESVNAARQDTFCHRNQSMENLPPTEDALLLHTKRAVFQAGIWSLSTETHQLLPSPQDFGWLKEDDGWLPIWITLPEISQSCRELVKCSCKGNCSSCSCGKANIDCSPLCRCSCFK